MKKATHELTQCEIAKFCGVTQGYISKCFNQKLKPTLQCGVKLKKLGFPLEIWNDDAKFKAFFDDLKNKKNTDEIVERN